MQGISKERRGSARPMRFTAGRNQIGLTERQVAYCVEAWPVLCADQPIAFNTSEAVQYGLSGILRGAKLLYYQLLMSTD